MKLHVPGRWHDGLSAAAHEVEVHAHVDALHIVDHAGQLIVRWPLPDVRCTEEHYSNLALRLTCRKQPDARLIVDDSEFAAWLHGRIVGYHGARDRSALWLRLGVALLSLVIVATGAITLLPKASAPLTRLIPQSWEDSLGDHVAELLLQDEQVCRDQTGETAISALIERLSGAQGLEQKFRFISSRTRRSMLWPRLAGTSSCSTG